MSELIPRHGGYRKLKSFQVAQLIYDVTVRFCDRYIDRRSRTHDQMVQAARSGEMGERENPFRQALINRRCENADDVAARVVEEAKRGGLCGQYGQKGLNTAKGLPSTESMTSTQSKNYPEFSANAALTLLALAFIFLHYDCKAIFGLRRPCAALVLV